MTAKLSPPCRYVYVIGPEYGWQKIGIAVDSKARLATLQTASPNRLRLHASVAVPFGAAHCVEAHAHAVLRPWAAMGEWFAITPAEAIAAVRAAVESKGGLAEGHALPLFAFAAESCEAAAQKEQLIAARLKQSWGELIGARLP